jgi:hypothetical protein
MREQQQDFPCLVCGRVLYRNYTDEGQPNDGVVCTTHGNYGSCVFDDMDGEYLAFNICDECLKDKGAEGRIFITRGAVPVRVEGSRCGWYRVDRPYVPWHAEMRPSEEDLNVELDEIIENTYSKKIEWNDKGAADIWPRWPEVFVGDYFDRHPDEVEGYMTAIHPQHRERFQQILDDYQRALETRKAELARQEKGNN